MARSFKVLAIHKDMYPATYNFKDEVVGTSGTDIDFVDAVSTAANTTIIASFMGHKKVLKQTNIGGNSWFQNNFSDITATIKEFYIATNDVTKHTLHYFYDEADVIVDFRIFDSEFQEFSGGTANTIPGAPIPINNVLYHIKIQWYADNTWDLWIDGVQYLDGKACRNNMTDGIEFMKVLVYDHTSYWDAFGNSEDANYNVGDNCHWRHYKESAADTLEENDTGTQGTSITWVDSVDTAASFEIVAEFNEHKKVLRCKYTSGAGGYDKVIHNYALQSTTGLMEGWVKASDATIQHQIEMQEDLTTVFVITIYQDKFQYYDDAWHDVGIAAVDATWYHIFVQWYADNTMDIWVNNVLYIDGGPASNNMVSGINKIAFLEIDSANFCYYDAFISSLDGDERGDNRLFAYNSTYTSEDITSKVENVFTTNRLGKWREGNLTSKETYQNSEIFVQVYDVNDRLAMEADLKKREQNPLGLYTYPLRDKNQDDLENESSNTFSADKIHDPTDSTSMLKVILPNVSEADGDLILVDADTKTDTYSPTTVNYPDYKMLTDIGDLADSVVIIHANGKCYLDDGKASGTALDFDTEADHDKMSGVILVTDILETINYFVIKGDFNPDTGTRFVKVIDNVGTDKKRSWRYTNNNFKSQADVDNYAAVIDNRITTIKIIKITVQSIGAHNMGETLDYKYVDAVYNVPQANYYIIFEQINFNDNENVIILSEGMIEESKYAAGYERPEEYTDAYASGIYATDLVVFMIPVWTLLGSAQVQYHVRADNTEAVIISFSTEEKLDVGREIIIKVPFKRIDGGGDTVDVKLYLDYWKHDGSDKVFEWDAVADTLPAVAINKYGVKEIAIPANILPTEASVTFYIVINEAGKQIDFYPMIYKYYQKRSV